MGCNRHQVTVEECKFGTGLGLAMISCGYMHVWSLEGLEFDIIGAVHSAFDEQSILLLCFYSC
jgi:hypothetical protein